MTDSATRLAITVGDPAGIGPEIVLKALARDDIVNSCAPLVVGDAASLSALAGQVAPGLRLSSYDPSTPAVVGEVQLVDVPWPDGQPVVTGQATARGGQAAFSCLQRAVDLCLGGHAEAMVTAPLNKFALDLAGHGHQGHTELLQEMTDSPWSITTFVTGPVRAVFLTRHLPLREAVDAVTAPAIAESLERFASRAYQLGLDSPRIAVAGLNPHAGEGGLCGTEEIEHIIPGIEQARQRTGLNISGPIPADSVFHLARDGHFDVVLGLYHDQVAGALKALDFHGTVGLTLGLPFLRFTVDHGTAFDIAGRGTADERNMTETLRAAVAHAAPSAAGIQE